MATVMNVRRSGGSFREKISEDLGKMSIDDFSNPWNFYSLMMLPDSELYEWFRRNGLLAETIACQTEGCGGDMSLKQLATSQGGSIFRCNVNRNHQKPCRTFSFFEKSNLLIQDIMLFLKSYLDRMSLHQCAKFAGIAYGSTAVNWASFVREVFKENFERSVKCEKLSGIIEIDESLFGRRVKHHRGNPNVGLKVNKILYLLQFVYTMYAAACNRCSKRGNSY